MTFREFKASILEEVFTYGGGSGLVVATEPRRSKRVIAAAALVIQDRGPTWCINNPETFERELIKYLGWGLRIALLFTGGGTVATLVRILAPVVIRILQRQFSAVGSAGVSFDCMATEARQILKGKL